MLNLSVPRFLIYKKEIVIVPTLQVVVLIKKDGVYIEIGTMLIRV